MRLICTALLSLGVCLGDTLTLRGGGTVEGTFLGGDARTIRMLVGEKVETFGVADVASIAFGGAAPTAEAKPWADAPNRNEVPAGAMLVVRLIDDIDSERHTIGQLFRASLDEPVLVDGRVMIERGADVMVKLIDDKQSGKLTGRTELTLDVVSITVAGRTIGVATADVTQQSDSRTGQTARRAGALAAAGAVLGGIVGGGRGAAAGAAAGGATGAGIQIMTKGQRVRIPSETRLSFTLQQALPL
jgi:hypothetical protein